MRIHALFTVLFGSTLVLGLVAAPPVPLEYSDWVTPNDEGGYNIQSLNQLDERPPGNDHSPLAQWAIDNTDPFGTVCFGEGDFYFGMTLYPLNFVGTIKGMGMKKTVMHTMEGLDYRPGEFAPMLFDVQYNRDLGYTWVGEGQFTLSDFKVVVDGPTVVWPNHGRDSTEVEAVVVVADFGILQWDDGGWILDWTDPTGVNLTFRNICAVGTDMTGEPLYPWGRSLLRTIAVQVFSGGSIDVEGVVQSYVTDSYFSDLVDVNLTIDRLESEYTSRSALWISGLSGSVVTVSELSTIGSSGLYLRNNWPWHYDAPEQNSFSVYDCTIDMGPKAFRSGIAVYDDWNDGLFENTVRIDNNTVHGHVDAYWPPIFLGGLEDVVVDGNVVSDSSSSGINLWRSSGVVADNKAINNRGPGVRIGGWRNVDLFDNKIRGNSGDGVLVRRGSIAHLHDNKIMKNGGAGVRVVLESTAYLMDNKIKHNAGGEIEKDDLSQVVWLYENGEPVATTEQSLQILSSAAVSPDASTEAALVDYTLEVEDRGRF